MTQAAEKSMLEAKIQKFLAVEVLGHGYGIPIESVKEIVYHTSLNPLPQTPDFVRGVSLIRNETMPVLDLNILLGKEEVTPIHNESCFIVVQLMSNNGKLTYVCLLADRILQTYKIDRDDVENIPKIDNQAIVEYVRGVARFDNNVYIVIEPAGLISPYIDKLSNYDVYQGNKNEDDQDTTAQKQNKNRLNNGAQATKYISVHVHTEEYAIPLTNVFQIVCINELEEFSDDDVPDFLTRASIINNKVIGIIRLKDILSKNKDDIHDVESEKIIDKEVVVIVYFEESMLGIIVDKIGHTYEVYEKIKKNSLCTDLVRDRVKSLGFIDSENGSIEVIEPGGLLIDSERSQFIDWIGCMEAVLNLSSLNDQEEELQQQKEKDNPLTQYAGSYLVVQVGEHLLGIKNDNIDEVLTFDQLIPLSNSPAWFMGLIDLRKNTYPVIDLHSRLDIPYEKNVNEKHKVVVVVKHQNNKVALHVLRVVNSSQINQKQLHSPEKSDLCLNRGSLFAIAELDMGLVHIVNMEKIISYEEISSRRLLEELENK